MRTLPATLRFISLHLFGYATYENPSVGSSIPGKVKKFPFLYSIQNISRSYTNSLALNTTPVPQDKAVGA